MFIRFEFDSRVQKKIPFSTAAIEISRVFIPGDEFGIEIFIQSVKSLTNGETADVKMRQVDNKNMFTIRKSLLGSMNNG